MGSHLRHGRTEPSGSRSGQQTRPDDPLSNSVQESPMPDLIHPLAVSIDQSDFSGPDLGRLLRADYTSVADISDSFQFAPFQQSRSTDTTASGNNKAPLPSALGARDSIYTPTNAPWAVRSNNNSSFEKHQQLTTSPSISSTPVSLRSPSTTAKDQSSQLGRHVDVGDSNSSGASVSRRAGEMSLTNSDEADLSHAASKGHKQDLMPRDLEPGNDLPQPGNHDSHHGEHGSTGSQDRDTAAHAAPARRHPDQLREEMPVLNRLAAKLEYQGETGEHEHPRPSEQPSRSQQRDSPTPSIVTDLTFELTGERAARQLDRARRAAKPRAINRPIADTDPSLRPFSRLSNTSRHRHPSRVQKQTVPPPREVSRSPHAQLRNTVYQTEKDLASYFNGFLQKEHVYRKSFESKVARLKDELAAYEETIAEYEVRIEQVQQDAAIHAEQLEAEASDHVANIQRLREDKGQLEKCLKDANTRLDKKDRDLRELADRCHKYKDRFNDALTEQQQLYLNSKQSIKQITAKLEDEIEALKSRDASAKENFEKSEKLREDMQSKVNSVISETRHKFNELNQTITSLRAELAGRQRELDQERSNSAVTRTQLDASIEATRDTLQSVVTENAKIVKMMEGGNFENIEASLRDIKAQVLEPTKVLDQIGTIRQSLNELHEQGINLDNREKVDELLALCRSIDESKHEELEWQRRYQEAHSRALAAAEKHNTMQREIEAARQVNDQSQAEIEKLNSEMAALRLQDGELRDRLDADRKSKATFEVQNKNQIAEQKATIQSLEKRLRDGQCKNDALRQVVDNAKRANACADQESLVQIRQLEDKLEKAQTELRESTETGTKLESKLKDAAYKVDQLMLAREEQDLGQILTENSQYLCRTLNMLKALKLSIDAFRPMARVQEHQDLIEALSKHFENLEAQIAAASKLPSQAALPSGKTQEITEFHNKNGEFVVARTAAAPDMLGEHLGPGRRVTVVSPVNVPDPVPPTIAEERHNRRTNVPGKSNLRQSQQSQESQVDVESLVRPLSSEPPSQSQSTQAPNSDSVYDRLAHGRHMSSQMSLPIPVTNDRKRTSMKSLSEPSRKRTARAGPSQASQPGFSQIPSYQQPILYSQNDGNDDDDNDGNLDDDGDTISETNSVTPAVGAARINASQERYFRKHNPGLITYGSQKSGASVKVATPLSRALSRSTSEVMNTPKQIKRTVSVKANKFSSPVGSDMD